MVDSSRGKGTAGPSIRHAASSHAWLAAVICVAFGAAGWAVAFSGASGSPTIQGTDTGYVVASVSMGTTWWARGIRPGMTADPWPNDRGQMRGYDVSVNGVVLGVGLDVTPAAEVGPLAGAVLVLIALAIGRVGLPGRALLLVSGVWLALNSVYWRLGFPWALAFVCLPVVVAAVASEVPQLPDARRFKSLAVAAILGAAALVAALALTTDTSWSVIWATPEWVGAALLSFATAIRLRSLQSSRIRFDDPMPGLMDLVPMAQKSNIAGHDAERKRLASEVHDEILPRLSATLWSLEHRHSAQAAEDLRSAVESLRGLMNDRQLVVLETAGLIAALENQVEAGCRRGLHLTFRSAGGDQVRPPLAVEIAAYRVAQTAIENALAHASASKVNVVARAMHDDVEVIVTDNGIGGITAAVAGFAMNDGHIGLAEMRQRAAQLHASLEVRDNASGGTTVRLKWTA